MRENLFKKVMTLLVAMSLVVGVMTGFVFTESVRAEAGEEQSITVYYGFQNLKTREDFAAHEDEIVFFVPSYLNIDFDSAPCLPTIPQGSAKQIIVDFDTRLTTNTTVIEHFGSKDTCGGMTAKAATEWLPSKESGKYVPNVKYNAVSNKSKSQKGDTKYDLGYVITVQKGDGFDDCATGGFSIGDGSVTSGKSSIKNDNLPSGKQYAPVNDNKFIYYGCSGGGVYQRMCPGNVVTFKTATVTAKDINASVKSDVVIPYGAAKTITKEDIQMTVTVDKQYIVPETLDNVDYNIVDGHVFLTVDKDDPNYDDSITVEFGGIEVPVQIHVHAWSVAANAEQDTLTATCTNEDTDCPVSVNPYVTLVSRIGGKITDRNGDNEIIGACTIDMSSSWYFVTGGAPAIMYKSTDNPSAAATAASPTAAGNYRATITVTDSNSVTSTIYKDFAIDADGNITASGYTPETPADPSEHTHQWQFTKNDDGTVTYTCVSEDGGCGETGTYRLETVVEDGEHETGDKYVDTKITDLEEGEITDEDKLDDVTPEPTSVIYVQYDTEKDENGDPKLDEYGEVIIKKDADGNNKRLGSTTKAPEGAGTYGVVTTYTNPDGSTVTTEVIYTIFKGTDKNGDEIAGDFAIDTAYHYVYPGYGLDYTKGWIYYTQAQVDAAEAEDKTAFGGYNFVKIDNGEAAREPLFNYPDSNNKEVAAPEGLYIDMYTETLVAPAGLTVAGYQLTKGGKWVQGELDNATLRKAFDKGETRITLAFEWDEAKKQGKGNTVTFKKTVKRPACDALKVNYLACADRTGKTNGQFCLTNTDGRVMYNIRNKYDVTIAGTKNAKNPSSIGWGVWPSTGGVWVPDMLKDAEGKTVNKTVKYTFFIRNCAKVNSTGSTFTPASKVKKLSVSSVQKPVTVKADYKKEILKLKSGYVAYFGEEILDILKVDFDANVKDFGTYTYNAVKSPAVAATETEPAADAVIEKLTFENFSKTYPNQVTVTDFANLMVDFNKDIALNNDLKKNGIDISRYLTTERNTVKVWQKATDKKPASATADVKFAKRGEITEELASKLGPDAKGKIPMKLSIGSGENAAKVQLEVAVTAKDKTSWKTAIPVGNKAELATAAGVDYRITEDIYPIRVKTDAKGGKETAASNATGIVKYALVTSKNIGTGRNVKMAIEKVELFDTEELAIAAKKIIKSESSPEQ